MARKAPKNPTAEQTAVSPQEIQANLGADKARALDVIRKARVEAASFTEYRFGPDITGKPEMLEIYHRYKREQIRGIQQIEREAFYSRINVTIKDSSGTDRLQLLFTKAREIGDVVEGEGWQVVSWTSPIANHILGKKPGDIVEYGTRVRYEVGESSRYEVLLPHAENASFFLNTGQAALVSEADLLELIAENSVAKQLPPREYSAKPNFGLGDIIVLVDEPQRAAMALPFRQSIVIDGPPGSGKTSIGIMRIAVLYDQQWKELGLERDKDKPFHSYNSMRVLVYNDEMVEYLKGLAQSIGVDRVQIETVTQFFRRVCRETKLISGTFRRDKPSLTTIKGRRAVFHAYFAGFRRSLASFLRENEREIREKLSALGDDFLAFADYLVAWGERVAKAQVVSDRIDGSIGLSDGLTDLAERVRRGMSPTRPPAPAAGTPPNAKRLGSDALNSALVEAQQIVSVAVHAACDRASIVRAMFETAEYREMLDCLLASGVPERVVKDGDRLWRKQYEGELPAHSDNDLAITAWLGAAILLTRRPSGNPWVGGRLERPTHLVLDEAQDVSPSHIAVLSSQIATGGSMTLVGDIHQNLNPYAGLKNWEEAALADSQMTAFGINHRQTLQLGEFLRGIHAGFFGEKCPWSASAKTTGPIPRAGVARKWTTLTSGVIAEIKYWREKIQGESGATVAVLYDGLLTPKALRSLQKRLELGLSDDLLAVELADPKAGGDALRKTDCVIIASVRQTKGLEFDAVIFVEPRPRWSKPVDQVDLRIRNGFYVAASRARAGLSLCMSGLPSCLEPLIEADICESVSW